MNIATTLCQPTAARLSFAQRATDFGFPCWFVDPSMGIRSAVLGGNAAFNESAITRVARQCLATDEIQTNGIDASLIAFPWAPDVVVIDLTSAPSPARAQWACVLKHFHADLRKAERDTTSINGFNRQLSQSYEEVNLIYRMAKLLTSDAEPEQVVHRMCDELRQTLNYGWLAMSFGGGDAVLAELRRKLLYAGNLPCDPDQFAAGCPAAETANDRVLSPGRHALADLAKSEVLIEKVTHDDAPVGVLVAGNRQGEESDVTSNEMQLVEAAGNFLGLFHQNAFRFAEQRRQFLGTLHALSAAVDAKDPYTRGHSERVALLGSQLARVIGLDADMIEAVRVAGLLHDIGKIGVPESVLRKPARLTDEEFALIKKHPETGYEILKDLPSLAFHLPGVLYHHERWDGRGYPHHLKGDAIPMIARLLSFADTFDAMSSNRAYRHGMDRDCVIAEIRKSSGTQLDPDLIEPFVTMDFTAFDQMLKEQGREELRRSDTIADRTASERANG